MRKLQVENISRALLDWILSHLFFQWPTNCLQKPTMDGLLRWPHSRKAIGMDPQDFHELLQPFLEANQAALNYLLLERQMSEQQKLQVPSLAIGRKHLRGACRVLQ